MVQNLGFGLSSIHSRLPFPLTGCGKQASEIKFLYHKQGRIPHCTGSNTKNKVSGEKKSKAIFSEESLLEGSQAGQAHSSLGGQLCGYFGIFQRERHRDTVQLNQRMPRVSSAKTSS